MDRNTVKNELDKLGINDTLYSLNGKDLDDRVIISKTNEEWYVYYTERGKRSDEKYFNDESEAYAYFFKLVKGHAGLNVN